MSPKEEKYLKLIEDNRKMIFKVASMYATTLEGREDLMQEIAYQLWRSFDSFESRSSQSTWLYRIALNTSIQFLKKEKRQGQKENLTASMYLIPDDNESEKETSINKMMTAVQQLKQIDKAIILLYLEEKSHQEISAITDLSVSNVGTRIQRIKKKLKVTLNKT